MRRSRTVAPAPVGHVEEVVKLDSERDRAVHVPPQRRVFHRPPLEALDRPLREAGRRRQFTLMNPAGDACFREC